MLVETDTGSEYLPVSRPTPTRPAIDKVLAMRERALEAEQAAGAWELEALDDLSERLMGEFLQRQDSLERIRHVRRTRGWTDE